MNKRPSKEKLKQEPNDTVQNPPEEPKRWMKNLGGKRNKDQQENGFIL